MGSPSECSRAFGRIHTLLMDIWTHIATQWSLASMDTRRTRRMDRRKCRRTTSLGFYCFRFATIHRSELQKVSSRLEQRRSRRAVGSEHSFKLSLRPSALLVWLPDLARAGLTKREWSRGRLCPTFVVQPRDQLQTCV